MLYYTSYIGKNGNVHHTVNSFNALSKCISMMKDVMFDWHDYTKNDRSNSYGNDYMRFIVHDDLKTGYVVVDSTTDDIIAKFFNKADADEYCKFKNLDMKYKD